MLARPLGRGSSRRTFGPPHYGQLGVRMGLDVHYPQMSRWGHHRFVRISTMPRLAGTAFVAAAVLGAAVPAALLQPAAAQTTLTMSSWVSPTHLLTKDVLA